jgi:hypothetical protein
VNDMLLSHANLQTASSIWAAHHGHQVQGKLVASSEISRLALTVTVSHFNLSL